MGAIVSRQLSVSDGVGGVRRLWMIERSHYLRFQTSFLNLRFQTSFLSAYGCQGILNLFSLLPKNLAAEPGNSKGVSMVEPPQ
jgi:hypothetical protein